MIYVPIPDDIRKYKSKNHGLTGRQMVFVAAGCAVAVPLAFVIPGSITVKILVAALVGTPIMAMGFLGMDGMTSEGMLLRILYSLITPGKRKYKPKNGMHDYYVYMERQEGTARPKDIKDASSVTYSQDPRYKVYR